MLSTPFFAFASLLLPFVTAQSSVSSAAAPISTSTLPACAITCTISSLRGTGCQAYGVSNITCICTDQEFQLAFYNCQLNTCSSTDFAAALAYGGQTCESNGTPIMTAAIPSGASTGSRSNTATGSSTRSSSTIASSSATTSSAPSSAPASSSPTSASGTVGTSAPASASPTGAATKQEAQKMYLAGGMVLAIAGGLAALF